MAKNTGEKILSVLSYIWILFLIPLIFGKKGSLSRYHANQGLVLFLIETVLVFVFGTLLKLSFVSSIISIVAFVFWILGIIHAVKGEKKPLPLIGGITIIK